MTGESEWTGRVGGTWAREWERTDRSFGSLTTRLLDPAAIGAISSALDIGCGAGEVAIALAARHPEAAITGLDISQELLSVARERGSVLGNLAFREGDAARWTPDGPADAPDLLISRHGVMFFDDPVGAFSHLRTVAAKRVRLRFSCFRERAENEWVSLLQSVTPANSPPSDPHAPGPFAFGEEQRVREIMSAAGWRDVALEPYDYAMIAGEGEDALVQAVAYFQRIGPAASAIADLTGAAHEQAIEDLRAMLAKHQSDGRVALPASAWIVTARAE
ncbi:MAG: class I SAM-dependent methyltransferase [Erythrobacter sp.]|nr:class I SAM-dependent methyltransferase [Erythrobacter sp.]